MLELRSKKSGWIGHQKNDQQSKITTYNPLWKQPTFVYHPWIAKNHTRKKEKNSINFFVIVVKVVKGEHYKGSAKVRAQI
jgi:hypothetical protein